MKLLKLTLAAMVIAFSTVSCSKQLDTPAVYPSNNEITADGSTASSLPSATAAAVAAGAAEDGVIQAENFDTMSGVQVAAASGAGAGKMVGWISSGDWMDYSVTVAASGNYDVNFSISSLAAGGKIQLKKADGTILTTVTMPQTGGWNTWKTVSAAVNLTAGTQVVRVYVVTGGWNLDWLQFTATQAAAVAAPAVGPMVQTPVSYNINANTGGYLQALPGDYATNTAAKYPLIIFFHGLGERGNGTTQLSNIANLSIPKLIKNGQFPASVTSGGSKYSFIVISPQFKQAPNLGDAAAVLEYAIKTYRVDASRIYLCGLSMGGGITWCYGGYNKKVAAIVPMCGWLNPNASQAKTMATSGTGIWAFHNVGDPVVNVSLTNTAVDLVNSFQPVVAPRKTIVPNTKSHDCWTRASDPNYRETINGVPMNIYEWMLTFKR